MTRKTGRRGESTSDRGSDSDRERRRDRGSDSDRERRRDRGSDSDRERRRASRKHMTSRRRSPKRNTSHDREPVKRSRRDSPDRIRDVAPKTLEKPAHKADEKQNEVVPEVPKKKAEETLLTMRTGGAYIPPARLKQMQAEISDKSSMEYQRISWEALKKSLHGLINKVNISNIGVIVRELFKENVVRGRGLLCRSIMQAQSFSPTFSHVYATLVSVINSKFPQTGELLLRRLVIQFRRGFRRNDKQLCLTSTRFIAHLVNQQVAHEVLALEILTLLLETPNEDSVEVAVGFLKECGMKLTAVSPKGVHAIFERLRSVLHEGQLDKRVQYMIEVMFAIRKDGFQDFQSVLSELDLVEESEQFTHLITLDEATNSEDILNVFKFDTEFEENEEKYKGIRKVILGEGSSGSEGSGSESDDGEEEEDSEEEKGNMEIIDNTETNLVALRRTIYLTIQSSLDFEECAHKLLKLELKPGQIIELCHMILDCCAQQRTYEKFYGLLAQRFCQLNKIYVEPFQEIFKTAYDTIHRFETNKLRNVAKFFAHLLYTDAIIWLVLSSIRLNEEDTTSSSRIFIKILFQELCEYMSLPKLNDRVKDPTLQEAFDGLFPRDNPQNTRFAINFFTSIGLGGLTDDLREHLKSIPKVTQPPVLVPQANLSGKEDSSSSDDEHDSSSEDESDESEEEKPKKKKRNKSKRSKAKKKSKHKKKDKKNKAKHLKEVPKVTSNQEHIQRLRSEIQHLEKEQEKLAREKERRRLLEEANKIQIEINREAERERVNRRSPPKAPEERRDAEERLHKSREGPEQDETRSKRDENTDRDRTQDRYQRGKRDEDKDRGRKDTKDRVDEEKEKGKKDLRNHTEEEKDRGRKDTRNHVDEDKDRGKKDRVDRSDEDKDRGRKDRTDEEKERSRKDTKDHSEEKTRGRKDLGERTDEEDRGRKDSRTRVDEKDRGRKDPRDRVDEEKDRRRKDQRDHADEEKDRGRKDRVDEERDRGKKDRLDDEKDKGKKGRSDEERDRGKKDTKDRVDEKDRARREVKDHVGEGKNDVKDKTERTRDLPRSIRDRSRERDRQRERVEDSPRKKKAQNSQEERKPKNYEWESSRKSGKSGDRNYSDRKRTRDGRVLAEMKV